MNRTSFATRHGRRVVTAGAAVATCAMLIGGSISSPAAAAGVFKSTTLLAAAVSSDGQQLTLTTTVRWGTNKNGYGVTPSGTVRFYDDVGDNLGTGTVPSCLNKPCTFTRVLSTDQLSSGVSRVTAAYSGDTFLKPSAASAGVALTRCSPDQDECTAGIFGPNADLKVESDSDNGYIVAWFGGPGLPCGVNGGGPVGNVTAINLTANKEIYYMLSGPTAQAYNVLNNKLNESNQHWFCYVSPDPFNAYSVDGNSTTFPESDDSFATFGPAPLLNSGPYSGQYVGLLGYCSEGDNGPCITNYSNYFNGDSGQWELSVDLLTPPGDPHFGGLKVLSPKKA